MTHLYTDQLKMRYQKQARLFLAGACFLGISGLIICTILCLFVNTGNAKTMLFSVIGTATLSAWFSLMLFDYGYKPAKMQAVHIENILNHNEQEYMGILISPRTCVQIPNSMIKVGKVYIMVNNQKITLYINELFLSALPPDGTHIIARGVQNYLTAFEVLCNEND